MEHVPAVTCFGKSHDPAIGCKVDLSPLGMTKFLANTAIKSCKGGGSYVIWSFGV